MSKEEISEVFIELCYKTKNLEEFKCFLKENKEQLSKSDILEKGLSWVISAITEYSKKDTIEKKSKFNLLIKEVKEFKHLSYLTSKLFLEQKDDYYLSCLVKNKEFKSKFIEHLHSNDRLIILLENRNDIKEKLNFLYNNNIYVNIEKKNIPPELKKYFDKYLLQNKVKDF